MNNEKRKLICTFLEKYLLKKFPTLEIKKDKLFSCPFFEEHSDGDSSPTCKIYSSHGYKLKCMHPSHSEHDLGDIFSIVRKVEPDMADLDDTDIGEYLIHMLDIQTDDEVDKTLAVYANSGFKLIPLQPNSKNPIEGVSWKKTMSDDLTQWHEWYDAHLNLGLVLGKESGIVAIDIDSPETMAKISGLLGLTAVQKTFRGMHFIYANEPDFDAINHVNFRSKGYEMELRANNAYIVVAPSSVQGEKRIWNGQKIQKMSPELKAFLLGLIDKPKEEINSESEKMEGCTLKGDLEGLEGRCNDFFTQMGGVLRKKLPPKQTEYALLTFNKALKNPMAYADIKRMMYQISKYNNYDKKELAEEVFSHLKMVEQSNARDLQSSLGYEKKDIEQVLQYLISEGKVIKNRSVYKAIQIIEWDENFISINKPLTFKVPYFDDIAKFSDGSMIIIGAKSGAGKSHLSCNFIKRFVDQGICPYLICTEADSKFGLISASLGLKVGDFKFKLVPDPSTVELEDNSVTIVDWLSAGSVDGGDYAKTEQMYRRFEEQLVKHKGLLIIFAQLKKENNSFYAETMSSFYASLMAKYCWSPIKNANGEIYDYDSNNTYFKTEKIRDSKLNKQFITIPTYFDSDKKTIELRKN
jgi:hypothetical protein